MPTSTQQLAELIREKRRVLTQLHQVSARQGELVAAGDVGALLKLLAAKQRLLSGLQTIEKALEPFRGEDPERRNWPHPQQRADCAADAEECRRLLAAVIEMEQQHERQMTERRDQLAHQLQRVHVAHGAAGAYESNRRPLGAPPSPTAIVSSLEDLPTARLDLTSDA